MTGNCHVRCGAGENLEIISKGYLSLKMSTLRICRRGGIHPLKLSRQLWRKNGWDLSAKAVLLCRNILLCKWLRSGFVFIQMRGCLLLTCSSVKKKAKINRPNRINRQERAKKKPNYCTNFQSRQAKGNRSDCEYGSCCKKRRYIQRPACKHAESPLS